MSIIDNIVQYLTNYPIAIGVLAFIAVYVFYYLKYKKEASENPEYDDNQNLVVKNVDYKYPVIAGITAAALGYMLLKKKPDTQSVSMTSKNQNAAENMSKVDEINIKSDKDSSKYSNTSNLSNDNDVESGAW